MNMDMNGISVPSFLVFLPVQFKLHIIHLQVAYVHICPLLSCITHIHICFIHTIEKLSYTEVMSDLSMQCKKMIFLFI
uniref:Uncharacterized protein n=1 Tax=Anguilla anguilla TaxID=7936 RepID=A0A0E9QS15_ANGAN